MDTRSEVRDTKAKAVNKFNTFWKLTANSYPKYIPQKDNEALSNVLDMLEGKDPLMRLASKSWLSDSSSHY